MTILFHKHYDGQQGAAQLFLDIDTASCHIEDFKVWDIEVYENTAIAIVTGHSIQQSKHLPWVDVSILCCLTGKI